MSTKSEKAAAGLPTNSSHKLEHEAEGAASGAVAGGMLGAVAGPPGAVVGALDDDAVAKSIDDEKLDETIGVAGGELGAPNLKHPPATVGAFSSGASGAGGGSTGESEPADGPMQTPES